MSFHSVSFEGSSLLNQELVQQQHDQQQQLQKQHQQQHFQSPKIVLEEIQFQNEQHSERQRQLQLKHNHQKIDLQLMQNQTLPQQLQPMYYDSSNGDLELGALQYGHQDKVFTKDGTVPISFHIPADEPKREYYKRLIESNGGFVSEGHYLLINSDKLILVTSKPTTVKNAVTGQFLEDCVNLGTFQNPKAYRSPQDLATTTNDLPVNTEGKVRSNRKFNQQKDEFILDEVRKRPRFRNSHIFFEELKNSPILHGHTGNSIRSRYRNHLQDKLQYIYKVDANDVPILDSNKQYIKIGLEHLPATLKNKYTPLDDYILCREAVAYMKSKGITDSTKCPYSFFGDVYKKNPHHSLHSWRDHYRKYFTDKSPHEYVRYYRMCEENGVAPVSASGPWVAHAKSEPNDRIGALDEEIGETKNSNAHDVMSNSVGIAKPHLDSLPGDEISSGEESEELYLKPKVDTQHESLVIEYLPEDAGLDSVINVEQLAEISANPAGFVDNVVNVAKLGKSIFELGFTKEFISHALMSSSNDASLMHTFLCATAERLAKLLEAGENVHDKVKELISTDGIAGLWTEVQDFWLHNKPSAIKGVFSEKEIAKRSAFLNQLFGEETQT